MVLYDRFITMESGEGAGKSTLILKLANRLLDAGIETVVTREPGGSSIAESIRNVILNPEYTSMDPWTEALLYAAARRQHIVDTILPALQRGAVVLCDRYIHSSLVYQGYARGLGIGQIFELNRPAIEDCMPGMTIFLDIDPKVGLARIQANPARECNRLDLEAVTFHQKVREGYQSLTRIDPRVAVIDADQPPEEVDQLAWALVQKHLGLKVSAI